MSGNLAQVTSTLKRSLQNFVMRSPPSLHPRRVEGAANAGPIICNSYFQAINTLLTQNLGFFDAMGQKPFFVCSRRSRRVVRHQNRTVGGQWPRGFRLRTSPSLLLTISFGFAMTTTTAIRSPAMGTSFHQPHHGRIGVLGPTRSRTNAVAGCRRAGR